MKKRADLLLVEKKIVETRAKAQAMIMAGQIFINGKKVLKSGELYNPDVRIVSKSLHPEWVSRGALKLLHAFEYFKIDVTGFNALILAHPQEVLLRYYYQKKFKKFIVSM